MHYAYAYMKDHGISAQKDYEYEGRTSRCKNSTAARANITITGFVFVDPNEEALRQAVGKNHHFISISIIHFKEQTLI